MGWEWRGRWGKVKTKISLYKSSKRAGRGIITTIQVQTKPKKRGRYGRLRCQNPDGRPAAPSLALTHSLALKPGR